MGINQIFSTFAILISLLTTLPFSYAESNPEKFVQCLEDNSDPSSNIHGVVSTPNDASYPTVLQSYIRNLRFNTSTTPKPLLIITATHESHVKASIVCSKKLSVQMKIRSGGHDYEGISYVSLPGRPFFILDMNMMRKVKVDVSTETAWAEVGATLGEVYYYISNASRTHGFPAGVCPTVGVGGHFSGGGYGNMMRKYGLSVDNIVDAKMVDVNGNILDRKAMGKDLFWAIRGGGGASFGVVLAYKVRIIPVPEIVTVFNVARTLSQNATEIVYKWELVAPKLDEDLFIRLIMNVVNDTKSGEKTISASFFALFLGDSNRLLSIMKKDFPELGLTKSDCLEMSWAQSVIYYTSFPLGTPNEALLSRTPQVLTHLKRKSDYVKEPIPKEGLEYIWKRMIELETPVLTFNPYGGKMAKIPANDTPFPHRAGNLWKIQYAANWNEDGDEAAQRYIELTRKLYNYMTPFVSKNPREAFLNYRDLDLGINHNEGVEESYEEGKAYGIKYFKGNFNRLVAIKTKVDPDNFFRNEQSVPILPY